MSEVISFLQVENLSKYYGENILFENISFGINKDQKVALIAKNGTGKSTLLDIIARQETPDTGQVTMRNNISMGYLPQNPDFDPEKTIFQQVFHAATDLVTVVKEYEQALQSEDKDRMQKAIEKMDASQAWDFELKIKQILTQLKIDDLNRKVGILSGGQRKRLALANVLIDEPDFLILDEPTNHLDLDMIEWLEVYLKKTNSTLLMVTHDRYFLDRVCNEIIEMADNRIYTFRGNYSYYLAKRQERMQHLKSEVAKANQLLKGELEWMRRMPKARGTKSKSRIDNIEKLKHQAAQKATSKELELNIKTRRLGKKILEIEQLSKAFDDKNLIKNFSYKFVRNEKIGIAGNNGTGKTTFLNLITGNLQPDSGKIDKGETVYFGYYKQSGIKIKDDQRVIEVIKDIAEYATLGNGSKLSAAQFLEYFLFPKELHYARVEKLSGGEKRRLYLMTVLMNNPNFLILDEPTNDLDIVTLNVLEDFLKNFNGCLLIVSHDRYFMDKVVDTLFVFDGQGNIKNFPGNYSQYRVYREQQEQEKKQIAKQNQPAKKNKKPKSSPKKFSYKEKREYESLEKELEKLESEKNQLEKEVNSGNVPSEKLVEKSQRLSELLNEIDEKEMRWLELSELM